MHTALHAIGWGLPRLAFVVAAAAFAALITYAGLVSVIVGIQAVQALST